MQKYHPKQFLWATFLTLIFSTLIALLLLHKDNWFGAGDLKAFIFWALPLGLVSGFLIHFLDKKVPYLRYRAVDAPSLKRNLLRHLCYLFIGFSVGFLWTLICAVFLGFWFLNFSFSVLACFTGGSACAFFLMVRFNSQKQKKLVIIVIKIGIVMILSLFQAYEFDSLYARFVGIQELSVSTFRLKPQGICRPLEDSLTDEDKKLFQKLNLEGCLELQSSTQSGQGPKAKAIIILETPLQKPVTLFQPDRTTIIYYQEKDDIRMFPENARVNKLKIEFIPRDQDPLYPDSSSQSVPDKNVTSIWVEHKSGGRSSADFRLWD